MEDESSFESYRSDLTAALARIDQLEGELATFRADPAYERVALAEAALARGRARREALQRLLPRICIASFVMMGAFALTNPSLPAFVQVLAYALAGAGALTATATIVWILGLSAQGPRPKKLLELERRVRLAKGDVGMSHRTRVAVRLRTTAESASTEAVDDEAVEVSSPGSLGRA